MYSWATTPIPFLLFAVVLVGCQDREMEGEAGGLGAPCTDCIETRLVTVLGTAAGEGFLENESQDVVVDHEGRFWVGQRGGIKVFRPDGEFVRTVGRPGQGPMEFGWARPNHVDGGGRIHVIDERNLRESIITTDAELVGERRLPAGLRTAVPISGSSDRYVANMWLGTAESMGEPLHVIDGPDVVRSFGARLTDGPATQFTVERVLARGEGGTVAYSAEPYNYRIEAWNSDMEQVWAFDGPLLNDPPHIRGPFAPDNPPPNRLFGIQYDNATGLLIVLLWRRKTGWEEHMVEAVAPDGSIRYQPAGPDVSYADFYAGRVDLIDLEAGSIVTSLETDQLFTSFAGPRLALEARQVAGAPQIGVWHLSLTDPRRK